MIRRAEGAAVSITIRELAGWVDGEVVGDAERTVERLYRGSRANPSHGLE